MQQPATNTMTSPRTNTTTTTSPTSRRAVLKQSIFQQQQTKIPLEITSEHRSNSNSRRRASMGGLHQHDLEAPSNHKASSSSKPKKKVKSRRRASLGATLIADDVLPQAEEPKSSSNSKSKSTRRRSRTSKSPTTATSMTEAPQTAPTMTKIKVKKSAEVPAAPNLLLDSPHAAKNNKVSARRRNSGPDLRMDMQAPNTAPTLAKPKVKNKSSPPPSTLPLTGSSTNNITTTTRHRSDSTEHHQDFLPQSLLGTAATTTGRTTVDPQGKIRRRSLSRPRAQDKQRVHVGMDQATKTTTIIESASERGVRSIHRLHDDHDNTAEEGMLTSKSAHGRRRRSVSKTRKSLKKSDRHATTTTTTKERRTRSTDLKVKSKSKSSSSNTPPPPIVVAGEDKRKPPQLPKRQLSEDDFDFGLSSSKGKSKVVGDKDQGNSNNNNNHTDTTVSSNSSTHSGDIHDLQDQLADALDKMKDLTKDHKAGQAEMDELRATSIDMKMALQEHKERIRQLENEVKYQKEIVEDRESTIANLETALDDHMDQVDEVTRQLDDAQHHILDLEAEIEAQEAALQSKGGPSAQMQSKLNEAWQSRMDKKRRQLDQREESLEEREDTIALQERILRDEISESEVARKIFERDQKIAKLKEELSDTKFFLKESENKFEKDLTRMRQEFELQSAVHNAALDEKDEEIRLLKLEVEKLTNASRAVHPTESGGLESDNTISLRNELNSTHSLLQVARSQYEGEKNRSRMLEEDIEHWKSLNCELEDEVAMLKAEAAELREHQPRSAYNGGRNASDELSSSSAHGETRIGNLWNRFVTPTTPSADSSNKRRGSMGHHAQHLSLSMH